MPSSITQNSTINADSTVSGGSSGGSNAGSSGGSTQKVNSDISVKIWDDLTSAINGIVGSYGKVTTAQSTGTITVTAPPSIQSKVGTYISNQNMRLAKQVTVNVQVLNVAVNDSDNYNFNLQGVFKDAAKY